MEKKVLRALFGLSILFLLVSISFNSSWAAEKYPTRPIEMICGYAPGGQADVTNRLLGRFLEKYLGVSIVHVYKPGAGGAIAATYVANARPDGYTIYGTGDSLGINILIGQTDAKFEDFRIFAQLFYVNHIFGVPPDSPWRTFQDFMDYAKKNPGVRYTHAGVGSSPWILMEDFNKFADLKLVGVPFKSDSEAIPAVIGKHVPIGIFGIGSVKPQVDAGLIKALFSFEPPAEFGLAPTIPDFISVFGTRPRIEMRQLLVVPSKTPDEIVQVLEQAAEKMAKDPEFVVEVKKLLLRPGFTDSKTLMQSYPEKMARMKKVLQEGGAAK
jgi:tripartite-type tricarboxylate transporter receptor subunit TctC